MIRRQYGRERLLVLTVEDVDLRVYYHRGVWARSQLLPYRDYYLEYPPLSALLFAAPHAIMRLARIAPSLPPIGRYI